MAVYNKFDNGKPVNRAVAVAGRPPLETISNETVLEQSIPVFDGMAALDAKLDTRFKAGGSTTWERPAASGV